MRNYLSINWHEFTMRALLYGNAPSNLSQLEEVLAAPGQIGDKVVATVSYSTRIRFLDSVANHADVKSTMSPL